MKAKRFLALGLCASAFGCVPVEEGPVDTDTIKVGAIYSRTGTLAQVDMAVESALMMAVDDINAAGGINGRQIEVISKDGQSDPAAAKAAAEELQNVHHVPVIFGGVSSGFAEVILKQVLDRSKTIYFGGAATSIGFRGESYFPEGHLWRVMGSDLLEAKLMARVACEKGYKVMSKLSVDNAFGNEMVDAAAAEFVRIGGTVVGGFKYPEAPTPTNFTSILNELKDTGAEAVFYTGYPGESAQCIKDWKSGGYSFQFIGSHSIQNPGFLQNVQGLADGLEGISQYPFPSARLDAFRAAYQARYGKPPAPEPYTNGGYDVMAVVALAMAKADGLTAPKIEAAIREISNAPGEEIGYGKDEFKKAFELIAEGKDIDFQGVTSTLEFDAHGDAQTAYQIWKVQDGKFASPTIVTDLSASCTVTP